MENITIKKILTDSEAISEINQFCAIENIDNMNHHIVFTKNKNFTVIKSTVKFEKDQIEIFGLYCPNLVADKDIRKYSILYKKNSLFGGFIRELTLETENDKDKMQRKYC